MKNFPLIFNNNSKYQFIMYLFYLLTFLWVNHYNMALFDALPIYHNIKYQYITYHGIISHIYIMLYIYKNTNYTL